MRKVFVVGRFPPPIDGQTLATKRLAGLLEDAYRVERFDMEPPSSDFVENEVVLRPGRVRHYLSLRPKLAAMFESESMSPIIWTSISPALLGHLRDILITAQAFQPDQPVVGVVHRSGMEALFESPLTRRSASILIDRLAALVFLNEASSMACAPFIPDRKRFVIPNTIDAELIFEEAEVADARVRFGRPFRLLFLSNLLRRKGYLDVIRAVGLLRDRNVEVMADFVGRWGDEKARESFWKTTHDVRVGDRVAYHGEVAARPLIKAFYRRADAFVLPTYHPTEAQPLALLEAMNAGLPIVTTRQGGVASMFEDDAALFVDARRPTSIADAVEHLLEPATWRAYVRRARTNFQMRFTPEVVSAQWRDLLVRLSS